MNIVTKPRVYVLAHTAMAQGESLVTRNQPLPLDYERSIGLSGTFSTDAPSDGESLVETAGRICYKSWEPGLNKNVSRVRTGNQNYLLNVLNQRHGSVLEHVNITFLFHQVSRVFTHELVRHRVGVAISQESLRYVRIDENTPLVLPPNIAASILQEAEEGAMPSGDQYTNAVGGLINMLTSRFGLDKPKADFSLKKTITSALRRFAGQGIATDMVWTANIRTLRHCIEMRTDTAAEWEIRVVFRKVAEICLGLYPHLFQDMFEMTDGSWGTYHLVRARATLDKLECDYQMVAPRHVARYMDLIDGLDTTHYGVHINVPFEWVKGWVGRMKGNA